MAPSAFGAVKLSPQMVVDLALSRGTRARGAELTAQRAYVTLQRALGVFDLQFNVTPSYEYSQAPNLSGIYDLIDRTETISASVAKQFATGTNIELDYMDVIQNSDLAPGTNFRTPNEALQSLQIVGRQSLWRNAFGYADRLGVEIGRSTIDAALETREESLQTVILDAMTLFWNTFVAERQLQENLGAREKYNVLIKNVRQKLGFNLSAPGELPRLQAELEQVEEKVKSSSAGYLNALQQLMTAIQLDTKGDTVELDVPDDLPPVPQLKAKDPDTLRTVQIAQLNLLNAQRALAQVKSTNRPKLDLVAKAKTTGVEETNGNAAAQMETGNKPYYYIGVEFSSPLDSALTRGLVTDAEVALRQAENDLASQRDNTRDQLVNLERTVTANYTVAKSAIATVDYRARVVRELESAYRQGRQPLVEVIRAYNDLFAAQQDRANSIGQYHIALNQLAAARNELVANSAPPQKH